MGKIQKFFFLENIGPVKREGFEKELFFLKSIQKLIYLYHSGISKQEFLELFIEEIDAEIADYKNIQDVISAKITTCSKDFFLNLQKPVEFKSLGSYISAFNCLYFSLDMQASINDNTLDKKIEKKQVIINDNTFASILFSLFDFTPDISKSFISISSPGNPPRLLNNSLEYIHKDISHIVNDLGNRSFVSYKNEAISPLSDISYPVAIAAQVKKEEKFSITAFLFLEKNLSGIEYEILRIKRELMEIFFASYCDFLIKSRKKKFLELYYSVAEGFSFNSDINDCMKLITHGLSELLNIKELSFLFKDNTLSNKDFGNIALNHDILFENIIWKKVGLSTHSLSSILEDYTAFDEDEKKAIKRLYFYPLLLKNEIQGIVITSKVLSKTCVTKEESEFIKILMLLITQNILYNTQSKKIQELDRLASLGQMAATIAHEIRNPLGGVSLIASFLEKNLSDKKYSKMASDIKKAIEEVNTLITDFLAYSKDEKLNMSYCSLSELCNEILGLYSINIQKENIEIETHLPNIPKIFIDREKIKRVIINILVNAIHASKESKKIIISSGLLKGSQFIKIRDFGNGISEENIGSIFEPFFTTKTKGSGLGLAVSKKIIELHNGKIEVKNTDPGVETCIYLPS